MTSTQFPNPDQAQQHNPITITKFVEFHSSKETTARNEPTNQKHEKALIPFPAANNDYRYLRKRASILCAAFNTLPVDAPDADHAQAWNDIVRPGHMRDDVETMQGPMVKGPINVDYGTNVHIHPSCFINRDCYIADSADCSVVIGENTIIGFGARILGVTHPIDWRERQGRHGPSLAGDVEIGNNCFIGAGVTILPGVIIGDGCVVGAGSLVTRSVPAYHVVAGVPARALRKVASDVPDAPGLVYATEGDRIVVCGPARMHDQIDSGIKHRSHGKLFDRVQPWQWLDVIKTNIRLWFGGPRHIAVDVCALIVAASIGYWLRGSTLA